MINSSKILKIIFFVLLIITAAELFYFFFYQPRQNLSINNNMLFPTVTLTPVQVDEVDKILDQKTIKAMEGFRKGVTTKAILTLEREGFVKDIVLKHGFLKFDKPGSTPFEYALKLSIENNGAVETFYYSGEELNSISASVQEGGQTNPIDLNTIKIGDKVTLQETQDLTKDVNNSLQKLIITKLSE